MLLGRSQEESKAMQSPVRVLTLLVALGTTVLLPAQAKPARPKAGEFLAKFATLAQKPDETLLAQLLPESVLGRHAARDPMQVETWRQELSHELATAKLVAAREKGDDAVVRFTEKEGPAELELAVRFVGDAWVAAAARTQVVKSKDLDQRNGKAPAHLTLAARTSNEGYGKSAFSFTHVTADPEQCKNRMDLWYCHNGDLHAVHQGLFADLGKEKLDKATGLPLGVTWQHTFAPKKGNVYVLHCVSEERCDYYVKLLVTDVKADAVSIDWNLLSAGWNAPAGIAAPQPLQSNDGADGADGLCGKN